MSDLAKVVQEIEKRLRDIEQAVAVLGQSHEDHKESCGTFDALVTNDLDNLRKSCSNLRTTINDNVKTQSEMIANAADRIDEKFTAETKELHGRVDTAFNEISANRVRADEKLNEKNSNIYEKINGVRGYINRLAITGLVKALGLAVAIGLT